MRPKRILLVRHGKSEGNAGKNQHETLTHNVGIVTYGMTLRWFLMRWFHWSVEEFENLRNPRNGQAVVMQQRPGGGYGPVGELAKRG